MKTMNMLQTKEMVTNSSKQKKNTHKMPYSIYLFISRWGKADTHGHTSEIPYSALAWNPTNKVFS